MTYTHAYILEECIKEARNATCARSKCGSIVVSAQGEIIGRGSNNPAHNEVPRCSNDKSTYNTKVTDKTCCIHAEQRAMFDALRNAKTIDGATLYFIRLDDEGNAKVSGKPYCTICSKMALDVGIAYFALWHDLSKPVLYDTQTYNSLSYTYTP